MTSVLNVDTIADKAGTGPVGLTKQNAAKALLWYDGSGNTIDTSFSISSVTDSATGKFFPNLTNALASTKEIISGETARNGTPNLSGTDNGTGDYTYAFTNSMSSANYTINTDCHS